MRNLPLVFPREIEVEPRVEQLVVNQEKFLRPLYFGRTRAKRRIEIPRDFWDLQSGSFIAIAASKDVEKRSFWLAKVTKTSESVGIIPSKLKINWYTTWTFDPFDRSYLQELVIVEGCRKTNMDELNLTETEVFRYNVQLSKNSKITVKGIKVIREASFQWSNNNHESSPEDDLEAKFVEELDE